MISRSLGIKASALPFCSIVPHHSHVTDTTVKSSYNEPVSDHIISLNYFVLTYIQSQSAGTSASMHLFILQFFNFLILLFLVKAPALSAFATPIIPPETPQTLNNKVSTHNYTQRITTVPVPTAKVWCPMTYDWSRDWTVNVTQRAYDLLTASSMLGIHCQYGSLTAILGMNAFNDSNPPTGSKLAPVYVKRNHRNPEHVTLAPRSGMSWTFGSVRAYVCNYGAGWPWKTCDITELMAAKEIIEVACGSKLNANGETWPEPEGGPGLERQTAVGGKWRSWDEEKEYGFMDADDDSEWCEGIGDRIALPVDD